MLWDNAIFTYKGDTINGTIGMLTFPTDPFEITAPVHTWTAQCISKLMAGDPQLQMLPPVLVDANDAEEIQT